MQRTSPLQTPRSTPRRSPRPWAGAGAILRAAAAAESPTTKPTCVRPSLHLTVKTPRESHGDILLLYMGQCILPQILYLTCDHCHARVQGRCYCTDCGMCLLKPGRLHRSTCCCRFRQVQCDLGLILLTGLCAVRAGRQQSAGRMRPSNNALLSGLDDLEIPGDLLGGM